jgi:uncharacterized repeat protein (TIGR01451 family)
MSGRRFGKSGSRARGSARNRRLFPEHLESRQLLAVIQVTSVADAGPGTLRRAIQQANQDAAFDQIEFNLPGSGLQTIALGLTALPALTTPMSIDATTQPGYDGLPLVAIDGFGTTGVADGLHLQPGSSGSTIRGLAIIRFDGSGIWLDGSNNNVIAANALGAARSVTTDGNGSSGILLTDASRNLIGGTSIADRNLIVANDGDGVTIVGSSNRNVVSANHIGTGPYSLASLGNDGRGISISGGQGNIIGGETADEGNVIVDSGQAGILISGPFTVATQVLNNYIGLNATGDATIPNRGAGIQISGTATQFIGDAFGNGNIISGNSLEGIIVNDAFNVQIQGNWIGVGADGATAFGNGRAGISLTGQTTGTVIGGGVSSVDEASLVGNIIANNGLINLPNFTTAGVSVGRRSTQNSILSNSIYNNLGLGIDLDANNAVDPNDPGDIDTGGNDLINFPTITSAKTGTTSVARLTQITGVYEGQANATLRIQFFANNNGDPSNFGEGERYLGETTITTNNLGIADYTVLLTDAADSLDTGGMDLSATATDGRGNTSEFSATVVIESSNVADLEVTRTIVPNVPPRPVTRGQSLTYILTVTNNGLDVANNVVVTDALPGSWIITNLDITGGGVATYPVATGDPLLVSFGTLAVGQTETITVTVLPILEGTFTHTSTVSSDDLDSNLTNNSVSELVVVNLPIDLGLTLINPSSSGFTAYVGQQQTYRVMLVNTGEATATNVVMTATVPAGTTSIVDVFTGQGNVSIVGNTAVVSLSMLEPGLPVYIDILARIGDSTSTSLTVSAVADQVDINASNDSRTITGTVVPAADLVLSQDASLLPATIFDREPGYG